MRPNDALKPKTPAKAAGIRMDPPPSVPMCNGPKPAAAAAEAPPLEPPGVRSRFQGLRVGPNSRLWVAPIQPNVGVLVLPSMMAPAARSRSTIGASSAGTLSRNSGVPKVVRTPLVTTRSFTENGTPCNGPRVAPLRVSARSAAFACRRAWSAVRVTKALSLGSTFAIRSSTASTTSTGESFLRRISSAIRDAGVQHSSSFAITVSSRTSPQSRIQRIAQRVAEQVGAKDGQADRDAGEEHQVRRFLRVFRGGDREHAAPGGIGLGHAEAEKRQRRFDQDRAAELGGAEHDERPHGVGQDVAERDAQMAHADGARGFYVLHLADRQH